MTHLAKRTINSVGWTSLANLFGVVILFVRSVILADWLPVALFGVYAFGSSILSSSSVLNKIGIGGAFLYRHEETKDEEHVAAVHFTIKLGTTIIWMILIFSGILFFVEAGDLRLVLLFLAGSHSFSSIFLQTPKLILMRRVVHRRLAMIDIGTIFIGTAVSLSLAWFGFGIWALLAPNFVEIAISFVLFYIWKPIWRPKLKWSTPTVRYFYNYGIQSFGATSLLSALDRVDDLWTGYFLGDVAMGFYSRAYKFATYPRQVIALPVNKVVLGTYAELIDNRKQLSQAFFRTNALLIRTGFLASGILALIAPEFIRLLLGDKWLPMLEAFRLMLVFTLIDPLKGSTSQLFMAVGKPGKLVGLRLIQLLILVVGLISLGPRWGIAGVAIAVNLMAVTGMFLLFWRAKEYVDFSFWRLFGAPLISLIIGFSLVEIVFYFVQFPLNDWVTGSMKLLLFSAGYLISWFGLEYRFILDLWALVRRQSTQKDK